MNETDHMTTAPFTKKDLTELRKSLGDTGSIMARLDDIDLSRGKGTLDDNRIVLWTTDGFQLLLSYDKEHVAVGWNYDPKPEQKS